MNYQTILYNKPIQIELSKHAEKALSVREKPITAIVHLIFGCMVVKRVWFKEQVDVETTPVTDKLNLAFNVVRYQVCSLENIDGGAEPETFPLAKDIRSYVPDYLFIDCEKQGFAGEFTYKRTPVKVEESTACTGAVLPGNATGQA